MPSSRYPHHIAVLACLLARCYCGGYVLIPETTRVIENSTLRLDCIYVGNILVTASQWSKVENGQSLFIAIINENCSVGNLYPDIYNFECANRTFNTMFIISTNRNFHNTTFSCSFFVGYNVTTGTSAVFVVVPVSSVMLTEPTTDSVITTENSTVTFICNASAAHPRPNITWYSDSQTPLDFRDDVEIIKNMTVRFDYDGYLYTVMSILTFYPIKYDNGSSLYCNASNNERQTVSSTRKALLYVQYPPSTPRFFMRSNVSINDVGIIINNALTIRCKSNGDPLPSYKWTTSQNIEVLGENLYIENIKKTDDGIYSCMAYNSFATAGEKRHYNSSASIELTVLFPPDSPKFYYLRSGITEQVINSSINVVEGDDVSVLCNSTGKPHPVSIWNGTKAIDILSITSIRADVYRKCTSFNSMTETAGETRNGSESRELRILLLYPPDTPVMKNLLSEDIVEAFDVMNVIENSKIMLECSARSKPHSTLLWSHIMNDNIVISKQLTVNRIQRNQSGTYTCLAENEMVRSFGVKETGKNNRSIYVDVLYPPDLPTFYYLELGTKHKINTLPLKVIGGDSVSVLCNATGNPAPTSVWMDRAENSDILTVESVKIQYNTNNTCKSFNTMNDTFGIRRNGESSRNLSIIVLYPPRNPVIQIQIQPESKKTALNYTGILEGSDFRLYCNAMSNPPSTYKWTGPATNNHMSNTRELFVSNIQRNQSGPYICYAQNEMERSFGKTETGRNYRSIFFNILYKTAIKYFGASDFENDNYMITVNQSEETRLTCKIESNPFSNSTLFFKGRILNETIHSDTVSYHLINMNCSDAGRYICKGKNEYNYETYAIKELFLYVKCSPHPSADQPPEKDVSAALSDSAVFRFHAAPYYDPGITEFRWFKQENESRILLQNGTKTYISSSDIHSVLRINDVLEADYGIYLLQYNNSVGMNNFTFYLQQRDQIEEIHQSNDKNYLPVVIGIVIAVLVIVGITLGIVIYIRRYKQKTGNGDGDRAYDNVCGMNAKSDGNTSFSCEPVYEGLKPMNERGHVEMTEKAYDILKPKDSAETKEPVYTNLKL